MKHYKARQPVGRFRTGDIVGGLPEPQIQDLLKQGVIEVVEQTSKNRPAVSAKAEKEVKTDG